MSETREMPMNGIYMITQEQIVQIIRGVMEAVKEEKKLPKRLGETCTKEDAAREIGVSRCTIYNMIADGRLETTADGKRVMTQSIYDYLEKIKLGEAVTRKGRKRYV